jgi:hypothetical protein
LGNKNSAGQTWQVVYVDKLDEKWEKKGLNEEFGFEINRPFYIVSELPFNRVMEMLGNTQVLLKRWRNNQKAQQWWFDEVSKTVRNNQWKNYCFDIQSGGTIPRIRANGVTSRWYQMFRNKGDGHITSEHGKVVIVEGGIDKENAKIMVETKNGKVHQQWKIVYVDEYEKEPTKGQLNKKFGLYVERDFYVVSTLPDQRYLDLINNRNMVIKTPNGRKTQVWYFHQQSLTIRTRYNNQSWDIKSSGKTNDMQIWSTNSGWF